MRVVLSHNIHFYETKEIKDKERTKEIKHKERNSQKDINKDQTNIEENDLNQEKLEPIKKYNPIDTSK